MSFYGKSCKFHSEFTFFCCCNLKKCINCVKSWAFVLFLSFLKRNFCKIQKECLNWRLLKDGLISYKEYLEYFSISSVIYNDFHVLKMLFIVFNSRVATVFKKSVRSMIKAFRLWNEPAIIFVFFFWVSVTFIYWKWNVFKNYMAFTSIKDSWT